MIERRCIAEGDCTGTDITDDSKYCRPTCDEDNHYYSLTSGCDSNVCHGSCVKCYGGLTTNCYDCSAHKTLDPVTNECDCPNVATVDPVTYECISGSYLNLLAVSSASTCADLEIDLEV